MTWTRNTTLSTVELAIYLLSTPIVLYAAVKHHIYGKVGHLCLLVFIGLRLAAAGLNIANRNQPPGSNNAGLIINSIGLSPLLLSTAGFVREARAYIYGQQYTKEKKTRDILIEVILHLATVTGTALLAVGTSKLTKDTVPSNLHKDQSLTYAGVILLLLAWIALSSWAFVSFVNRKIVAEVNTGTVLLTGILSSLPFLGARVLYSVVYTFDRSPTLSPATASLAIEVCLIFLVQLIVFAILITVSILTRHKGDVKREDPKYAEVRH